MALEIPGRGAEQFTLRFPKGLRDWVKETARKNMRSMNSEIILALQEKMEASKNEATQNK